MEATQNPPRQRFLFKPKDRGRFREQLRGRDGWRLKPKSGIDGCYDAIQTVTGGALKAPYIDLTSTKTGIWSVWHFREYAGVLIELGPETLPDLGGLS